MAGATATKTKPKGAKAVSRVRQPTNGSAPVTGQLNRQQQDIQFRQTYGQQVAVDLGRLAGMVPEGEERAILALANATAEWCGIETRFTTVHQMKAMAANAAGGGNTS